MLRPAQPDIRVVSRCAAEKQGKKTDPITAQLKKEMEQEKGNAAVARQVNQVCVEGECGYQSKQLAITQNFAAISCADLKKYGMIMPWAAQPIKKDEAEDDERSHGLEVETLFCLDGVWGRPVPVLFYEKAELLMSTLGMGVIGQD